MRFPRLQCGVIAFVLLDSLGNSVLFQRPLYSAAAQSLRGWDGAGYFALATEFVVQLTVSMVLLTAVSLISVRSPCS